METLKAWVHWKRLEKCISDDERLFVEHINTIIKDNDILLNAIKNALIVLNTEDHPVSDGQEILEEAINKIKEI